MRMRFNRGGRTNREKRRKRRKERQIFMGEKRASGSGIEFHMCVQIVGHFPDRDDDDNFGGMNFWYVTGLPFKYG